MPTRKTTGVQYDIRVAAAVSRTKTKMQGRSHVITRAWKEACEGREGDLRRSGKGIYIYIYIYLLFKYLPYERTGGESPCHRRTASFARAEQSRL